MTNFTETEINGVFTRQPSRFNDSRGWLAELMRVDELPFEIDFQMAYISSTNPGESRGPHEHINQTDYFFFMAEGSFEIYLWDARKNSKSYKKKLILKAGENKPLILIIPPGVVHGYKNTGTKSAFTFNMPNKLYKGRNKTESVDEIRYEEDKNSPYQFI